MNDAFVAFWSGMLCGMIVGVMIFSVIVAIKTGELKREPTASEIFDEELRAELERRGHDDE